MRCIFTNTTIGIGCHQQNHWNGMLFYWYQSYYWYQWRPFLSPLTPMESICDVARTPLKKWKLNSNWPTAGKVFGSIVSGRLWGGVLRDEAKNDCVADQLQAPVVLAFRTQFSLVMCFSEKLIQISVFPIKEIVRSLMDAAFVGQISYLYPIVVQNRGLIVTPSCFSALFKSQLRMYLTR